MGQKNKHRAPKMMPLEKRLMLDASLPAIAGQVLWLDAADATTIRDADGDNAGTGTGGANNGFAGTVATWVDKSGSGFNVTQATAANRPTYTTNALNGNAVLTFDGTNDKLTNAGATIAGNDYTIFMVFDRSISAGRDAVFELGNGASRNALFVNDSANKLGMYVNTTFYNSSAVYTAGTYEVVTLMQDINAINMWRNNANQLSTTAATRASTTGIYIGDDSSGGDELNGHIAEIIVYDRDLTADERRDVENYLAGKWGRTITGNSTPVVATNTGDTLLQGTNATITTAKLASTDTDNSESNLRYTITDLADYGTITNTNTAHTYILGETFTQADIDAGYMRYTHNNTTNFADSFSFTVTDGYATTAASTFNFNITPSNVAPQFQGWTLVSSENFESGATGWSDNTTEVGGTYLTRFLGRHSLEGGAQNTYKTYTMTGAQDYTVVTFDMYKIDSWDGESFRVFINDSQVINLAFNNGTFSAPVDGSSGVVNYTVQELTPFLANFAFGSWNEQMFRFTLTIQNSAAANLKIGFSSTLDQATSDESWGVDNVNIYEVDAGGVPGPVGIIENSANGTVVGQVSATDANVGDTITYSIVGGTGSALFNINSSTGVITVNGALNYEATNSYTLNIRATDNGTGSLFDAETITINILDLPENTAPTINALGPISIAENTANNTVIGTITGSDAESNTITWSITGGNTDNIFAINAATGAIRVNSNTNLNYEWDNSYTLTVQGIDNGFGTLSSTRNVTVNITDVNEAPSFDIPQSFLNANPYLRYNATTGNFYMYVGTTANYTAASAAAAANMLGGVAGHLATITSAAENTYVRGLGSGVLWLGGSDAVTEGDWIWAGSGPEGGALFSQGSVTQGGYYTNWLAGQPDNSSNEDHLEMQAAGTWNDALTSVAKAYVIEWEGATVMAALGNGPFTLAENPALNQSVGFVHARDVDAGDTLAYSITGGTGAANFSVNATTGEITVTNPSAISYESATSYTLDMRVQDAAGLFHTQTVTINITDVNETPVMPAAGPFTVAENAAVNTVVGSVSATDPDGGQTITYSITGGNTNNVFAINAATGAIRIANTTYLDYELLNTYNLTVRATDNGTGALFASRTIAINVTNVNEAPSMDAVQRVLNADPTLHYSATTGNFYRLVSSNVTLAAAQSAAAAATVNGVAGYVTSITSAAENAYVRSLITTSTWIGGSDVAVEGTWVWTGGPENGQIFWQGTGSGSGGSAQNGFYSNWNGAGEPNNSGGNEDGIEMQTSGIWNDTNAAGTRPYVIEWDGASVIAGTANGPYAINENSALGSVVGTVAANDPDAGDTVTYSITGGTGAGLFALDATTGQITLTGAINYEAASSYTLNLRVEDAGGLFHTMVATVNIGDVNETPVLDLNTGASLNEGAFVTITNAMLRSSDVDTPSDSLLVYTVTDQTDNGMLYNTATGRALMTGDTFTQGNIDSGQIRYIHNDGESTADAFSFTVNDGAITLPAAIFNIAVTAVNEGPNFDAIQALLDADNALRYDATTGNFYKYMPHFTDFNAAQMRAGSMTLNGVGGYVAQSNSAYENALFVSMIGGNQIWLGGSDSGVEGEWVYTGGSESGEAFWFGTAAGSAQNGNYTNWNGGEPNQSGNEDNIQMYSSGVWNDSGSGGAMPYIVEWDGATVLAGTANGPYSIGEHTAINGAVGSAIAHDYDAGETLAYSITGGTGAGVFTINAATGAITLATGVNYEVQSSYTLDLRVQDAAGLFDTLSITITITDQNDVPGTLTLTGNHIIENSAVGTLIGDLSTFDEDPSDTHTYSLVTNPGGKFVIVNGNEIRTLADIDYEQNQSFSVIMRTDDGNGGTLDRTFLITVGDVMDTFTPPPATGGPSGPDAYIPPEEEETGRYVDLLRSSLGSEQGAFGAFYGDFRQIVRENVTFEIMNLLDGLGTGGGGFEQTHILEESLDNVSGLFETTEDIFVPHKSYTNLREAIAFLQQMADTQETGEAESDAPDTDTAHRNLPANTIDRQFVDVMTYHKDRAAKLRAALLETA